MDTFYVTKEYNKKEKGRTSTPSKMRRTMEIKRVQYGPYKSNMVDTTNISNNI